MYQTLLYLHSSLRYVVLALLVIVIVKSLISWQRSQPFTNVDDKLSLFLLIFTHTQVLAGLLLYFVSPYVQFNGTTMKEAATRYWTVEHIFMMLIVAGIITAARITQKKMTNDVDKFKRLYYFNLLALLIIIVAINLSGRGLFSSSMFSQ